MKNRGFGILSFRERDWTRETERERERQGRNGVGLNWNKSEPRHIRLTGLRLNSRQWDISYMYEREREKGQWGGQGEREKIKERGEESRWKKGERKKEEGRGRVRAWNSGSYRYTWTKNDVTIMRVIISLITSYTLIYCSSPVSCLSHLFSIRTAPLLLLPFYPFLCLFNYLLPHT